MLRHLPIVLACALSQGASAGTIYKCVEGGRVSYSDRPCSGAASVVTVPDAAPPDQALQERRERSRAILAQREKTRSADAATEQRQRERAQRAAETERRRCDKLRLQRRWAAEDLARQRSDVRESAREAARIKARRQAETLALECPA